MGAADGGSGTGATGATGAIGGSGASGGGSGGVTPFTGEVTAQVLTTDTCSDTSGRMECYDFTFDAAGHMQSYAMRECSATTAYQCVVFDADPNGVPLATHFAQSCDGTPTTCFSYDVDAAAHSWSGERDDYCDGNVDALECRTYTLDANGLADTVAIDDGCDGVADTCETRVYDASGRWLTIERDRACDGSTDSCFRFIYQDE